MIAQDGGFIPKQDVKGLTVTVKRNLNSPRFNETSLVLNIYEDYPTLTIFYTVDAYDLDTKVCFIKKHVTCTQYFQSYGSLYKIHILAIP